jgi:hypothetical protein
VVHVCVGMGCRSGKFWPFPSNEWYKFGDLGIRMVHVSESDAFYVHVCLYGKLGTR